MDTTYFGSNFGLMLFKDAYTKENLLRYYVESETNSKYKEGIESLSNQGYQIMGIVCDGRKGLIKSFPKIPVQMCQFHQVAIIRRYITKNPKLEASKELKTLVSLLKMTDRESFTGGLESWYLKWKPFLDERTINPDTGKSFYSHKRLRSAYRGLKDQSPVAIYMV